MLWISYALPLQPEDHGCQRYGKGPKDLLFLAFYIIVFSLVRQSIVLYVVRPLAIKGGIRGERKLERFTEQGYALFYWSSSSIIGLVSTRAVYYIPQNGLIRFFRQVCNVSTTHLVV